MNLLRLYFGLLYAVYAMTASPVEASLVKRNGLTQIEEWVAVGDSYASGVGAGDYDQYKRCFRFSDAYPRQLQSRWPNNGQEPTFNNVVCSGSTFPEILDNEFLDNPRDDIQYGHRPAYGHGQIGTLTGGGNDIEIRQLIQNCVIQTYKSGPCDPQIERSLELIDSQAFRDGLDQVLGKMINKGRDISGEDYRVFVAGYPSFFGTDDRQCDGQSFHWGKNSDPRYLSLEDRQMYKMIADNLNAKIKERVEAHPSGQATFVSVDEVFTQGQHRLCEKGVNEPAVDRPGLWLFHPKGDGNGDASEQMPSNVLDSWSSKLNQSRTNADPEDVLFDTINELGSIDSFAVGGGWLINAVKILHPKTPGHAAIATEILNAFHAQQVEPEYSPSNYDASLLGNVACKLDPPAWDDAHSMRYKDAKSAIEYFCGKYLGSQEKFIFGKGSLLQSVDWVDGTTPVSISGQFNNAASNCPPPLDMTTKGGHNICVQRLQGLVDACGNTKDIAYKVGGKFYRDCITWTINRG